VTSKIKTSHSSLVPRHFKSGKDVVNVSHTVNNVFSIVKRPQRGAAANLTISISINIATRNKLSGRCSRPWGVGRYPGRRPARKNYNIVKFSIRHLEYKIMKWFFRVFFGS